MIASQTSAIMDIGGGDFIGLKILTELSIVDLLQANNFKVTFLFPVGSDPDYLAPVARLLDMNLLEGADVIMALNVLWQMNPQQVWLALKALLTLLR